jgi:hypothetical protein
VFEPKGVMSKIGGFVPNQWEKMNTTFGCVPRFVYSRIIGRRKGGCRWRVRLQFEKYACEIFCGVMVSLFSCGACGQEMHTSGVLDGQSLTIHLSPSGVNCQNIKPIEIGKTFCIRLSVNGANALMLKDLEIATFDAIMPLHRHGMVTRPRIRKVQDGLYLIEGLKLHMPGEWKFTIVTKYQKAGMEVAIPLNL